MPDLSLTFSEESHASPSDPSSSSGNVRVSQEKNAPVKAPRGRTKVRMDDTKGEKEHEDEPPKKKPRRRAADSAMRYALLLEQFL
jgi:hypothetical protein